MNIRYKIFVTIFTTLLVFKINAQNDFNLFFEDNPQYDFCMEMLEMDNGDIVALHQYENIASQNPVYTYTDLPFQSFTVLKVYSNSSLYQDHLLKTLEFPCSDSLSYFGLRMFKLDDGRILIGGDVKTLNNDKYDAFIAVTNEDLTGFDFIIQKDLNNTTEFCKNIFLKENNNVLFYGVQPNFSTEREFLIEFDLNGNIVNERYNFNDGIYDDTPVSQRGFYFNKSFYQFYQTYGLFQVIKIDEFYDISLKSYNWYNDTLSSTPSLNLFNSGKKIDDDFYLYGSLKNSKEIVNESNVFLKFDLNDSLSVLYNDSNVLGYGGFVSNISNVDNENIYFAYQRSELLLYNIDIFGQLNWKKSVSFSDSTPTSTFSFYELQSILALNDNSCVVTIGAIDTSHNINTYITRIDKNGNVVDLFTGIIDRNNTQFKISDFLVSPNPAKDLIQIESLNYEEEVLVEMYNIESKLILSKSFKNTTKIDINNFETGVYFYQMKTEDGVLLEEGKLVKE